MKRLALRAARLARARVRSLFAERLEDRSLLAVVGYQVHLLPPGGSITGPELTTVDVGQSYDLAVTVQDLRANPGNFPGVFAGYLDIGFDSSKTHVQVAEIQKLRVGPLTPSSSGTFSLVFNGQTTQPIAVTNVAATLAGRVQEALAALSNVGPGAITVNPDLLGENGQIVLQVRFGGKFLDQNVASLVVASQSISGDNNPQVTVTNDGDLVSGSDTYAYAFREAFRSLPNTTFPNGLSAINGTNLLDEVGAFANASATGTGRRELVRARMVATAAGSVTFSPSLANRQLPQHDTLLFGQSGPIALGDLNAGLSRTLVIGGASDPPDPSDPPNPPPPPIAAVDDSVTFLSPEYTTFIDVLANDTTAVAGQAKKIVSVSPPAHGLVGIQGSKIVYTPAVNYTGTDIFTYTAQNVSTGGATSTATVTVNFAGSTLDKLLRYDVRLVPVGGALFMPDPQNPHSLVPTPDLTTINVGEAYDLVVTAKATDAAALGVFAAYLDIGYDSAKTQVQLGSTQNLHLSGSGTFTLVFNGQTTNSITRAASDVSTAVNIEQALAALTSVGKDNITLSPVTDGDFVVRFGGKYLGQNVATLTAGNGGTVSVTVTPNGLVPADIEAAAFAAAFHSRGVPTVSNVSSAVVYYADGVHAVNQPNLLDDVGAFVSSPTGPYPGTLAAAEAEKGYVVAPAREVVRARLTAVAAGTVTFTPDLSDIRHPFYDSLMYSPPGAKTNPIPASKIDLGAAKTLTISTAVPITAVDDTATTEEGVLLQNIDVLANDTTSPASGQAKAVVSVTQPAHGTVTFDAGSVSYKPASGFTGTDTFTYTARNMTAGSTSSTSSATVTVTVTPSTAPTVHYQIRVVPVGGALFSVDPQDPTKLVPTPDLTAVRVGQAYEVAVTVATEPGQQGVFAGYLDIGYNSSLTHVQLAEIQQIHFFEATGGTFSLSFDGQTTEPINYSSNLTDLAGAIEQRLAALPAIGAGNVKVEVRTSSEGEVMLFVRFVGKFLDQNVPNMTVASQALSGTNASVFISYEGDLAAGVSGFAFAEAFRSRGTQLVAGISGDWVYYPNGVAAESQADRINDVGAFVNGTSPFPGQLSAAEIAAGIVAAPARELVRARFVATATGSITFAADLSDMAHPVADTLVYGRSTALPLGKLDAGTPRVLSVYQGPVAAAADSASVVEDSATGVLIDVLANDWVSPWAGATKQLFSAGVLTEQGSVMIVGDRVNFVPANDFAGTAILRYTLRDATPGASPTASGDGTITVTVTPVNDAPRFTKGADVEVTDESGEQTVTGWATQIAAGPADEADQTLEFFVEASDTSLFTVQPRLNAAGTLTFTPAPNAGGVAEVTVRLKDNGGRASGGQDESEPQTFSIHIVKEHTLHNTEMPLDSSGDGGITSVDALNVINYINAFGAGPVDGSGEGEGSSSLLYVDTNADGHVSASDALDVINYINAFGPKQPAISGSGGEGEFASLLEMLAADAAAQAAAGRRKL